MPRPASNYRAARRQRAREQGKDWRELSRAQLVHSGFRQSAVDQANRQFGRDVTHAIEAATRRAASVTK